MAGPGVRGRARDEETIDYRMRIWASEARIGTPVVDIAARLRISKAALDRMVLRERTAGNPLAVYHAAYIPAGQGKHNRARGMRRAAIRRARAADAAT